MTTDGMTDEQRDEFAQINDSYGVASYRIVDGVVVGVAEDGDSFIIERDGDWRWTETAED